MKNLGGVEFSKRRWELLQRYVHIGDPLPAEQRANFTWFKCEWDRKYTEKHGNAWPDLFLGKLKGVLNKLYTGPTAFSTFLFDEEREVFECTRALLVPRCVRRPLPITLGE